MNTPNTPINPLGENLGLKKEDEESLRQKVLADSEKFEENEIRSDMLPTTPQKEVASQNPVQAQVTEQVTKDDSGAQNQSLVFAESPQNSTQEVENMVDGRAPKDIKELEGLQERATRAQNSDTKKE